MNVNVEVVDAHASSKEVQEEYGFDLANEITSGYDGIILAVAHDEYKNKPESWFKSICNENAFILDLKGIYRDEIKDLEYWSL